jgi:hypothetical protein
VLKSRQVQRKAFYVAREESRLLMLSALALRIGKTRNGHEGRRVGWDSKEVSIRVNECPFAEVAPVRSEAS